MRSGLCVIGSDIARRLSLPLYVGGAASESTRLAKGEGADMIVMSAHGHVGLRRVLVRSVAEVIVRRADCPVLIVKAKQQVAAAGAAR
jgi:nucleotide-binding universal stress UspA family protein